VFSVSLKFLFPVSKDEQGGIDQAIPGDNPVSMGLNGFGWCGRSMEEFEVLTEFDHIVGAVRYGVDV
jgi:hypothetical protein